MPLFEYRCRKCGRKFEALVNPGETQAVRCPECSAEDAEKLLSTFCSGGSSGRNAPKSGPCGSGGCCNCG